MSEIEDYQAALAKFRQAERKAQTYADFIADAGAKLRQWRRVAFANLNVGYPLGSHEYSIDGARWPTGIEIAQALAEFHTTLHEAENAYNRIPRETRAVVTPPPDWRRDLRG